MSNYKESTVFKSLIITLVITLLVPSFVKLAHADFHDLHTEHQHPSNLALQMQDQLF